MVSTEFKGVGLHYTAFRDAIREDSRQITPSRGVSPRKKFAVKANVESRVNDPFYSPRNQQRFEQSVIILTARDDFAWLGQCGSSEGTGKCRE